MVCILANAAAADSVVVVWINHLSFLSISLIQIMAFVTPKPKTEERVTEMGLISTSSSVYSTVNKYK